MKPPQAAACHRTASRAVIAITQWSINRDLCAEIHPHSLCLASISDLRSQTDAQVGYALSPDACRKMAAGLPQPLAHDPEAAGKRCIAEAALPIRVIAPRSALLQKVVIRHVFQGTARGPRKMTRSAKSSGTHMPWSQSAKRRRSNQLLRDLEVEERLDARI
jgi:hypothetical protein